jgi:glycosyltransferase involved in cell wall biosynthesis
MEIVQIATGLITIPPNGWGAVERIIWEYKQVLESFGNIVNIKYMNDIEKKDNLITHAHLSNQALHCRDLGIPYIYSLHDHHVEWYGKDSNVYKNNLEAIKSSIFSITHTEHYIDYFDNTDKLFYLRHGANTDFFKPNYDQKPHKLLMIANNGLGGDAGFDRKGYIFGIEAAKKLNLPITIAGHTDNKKFFEIHPNLIDYEHLTLLLTNPTDEETRALYQSHTIFLHPSMLEAGHPNLTLMEATACGIPIVGTYKGTKPIPSMHILNNITTEDLVDGILDVMNNYEERKKDICNKNKEYSWYEVGKILNKYYHNTLLINKEYTSIETKNLYINAYDNL